MFVSAYTIIIHKLYIFVKSDDPRNPPRVRCPSRRIIPTMTTKETGGCDFGIDSFRRYLTKEIKGTDNRITSVSCLEDDGDGAMEYHLVGESEGVKLSILIRYSPENDELSICAPLRNDANHHHQEGIGQFMDWWVGIDDGLLTDIGKTEDGWLVLTFEDGASAFYVEVIGDLVKELLDIVPGCARKLKEIFGENPK